MKTVNGPTRMCIKWNDVIEEPRSVLALMGDYCGNFQRED